MAGFEPATYALSRNKGPVAGFNRRPFRYQAIASALSYTGFFCRDSTPELHRLIETCYWADINNIHEFEFTNNHK